MHRRSVPGMTQLSGVRSGTFVHAQHMSPPAPAPTRAAPTCPPSNVRHHPALQVEQVMPPASSFSLSSPVGGTPQVAAGSPPQAVRAAGVDGHVVRRGHDGRGCTDRAAHSLGGAQVRTLMGPASPPAVFSRVKITWGPSFCSNGQEQHASFPPALGAGDSVAGSIHTPRASNWPQEEPLLPPTTHALPFALSEVSSPRLPSLHGHCSPACMATSLHGHQPAWPQSPPCHRACVHVPACLQACQGQRCAHEPPGRRARPWSLTCTQQHCGRVTCMWDQLHVAVLHLWQDPWPPLQPGPLATCGIWGIGEVR
jgi:hypothetical protein